MTDTDIQADRQTGTHTNIRTVGRLTDRQIGRQTGSRKDGQTS